MKRSNCIQQCPEEFVEKGLCTCRRPYQTKPLIKSKDHSKKNLQSSQEALNDDIKPLLNN